MARTQCTDYVTSPIVGTRPPPFAASGDDSGVPTFFREYTHLLRAKLIFTRATPVRPTCNKTTLGFFVVFAPTFPTDHKTSTGYALPRSTQTIESRAYRSIHLQIVSRATRGSQAAGSAVADDPCVKTVSNLAYETLPNIFGPAFESKQINSITSPRFENVGRAPL